MKQKIWLYVLMSVAFVCLSLNVSAKERRNKKKVGTQVVISDYEKLFEGKEVITEKNEVITLHKVGASLYFEIPLRVMGREWLLASSVESTTYNMVGFIGSINNVMHFRFALQDDMVQLRLVENAVVVDEADGRMRRLLEMNYADPVWNGYKVLAYTPDSSAVVVDVTSLFLSDVKELSPLNAKSGRYEIMGSLVGGHSLLGDIKAYEDNVTIKSSLVYNATVWLSIFPLMRNSLTSIETTRTLVLLPKDRMKPRVYDSRVGVFSTTQKCIPKEGESIRTQAYVHRWRLEPKDREAYFNGELTEPVKPITMYVDNNFPENWKEPIKKGILSWNTLFEKIGFKNAILVKDFPKDDPLFDPSNLKYSCVRYIPFTLENALAPSWTDPATGEIIQANILIFNDVAWAINNWRFVQTAQIDSTVRVKKMPGHILEKSLEYVAAHEMGHCLGLMHNMAASSCYPVDSLRSTTFTQEYGLSPSIMDYVRFNYIAQPGDVGVALEQTKPSVYDEFMIKWLYSYFPDDYSMEEEARILRSWVDEKADNPYYRYGKEQDKSAMYDPSSLEEDLGDEPIQAAEYGIANLKYIISHINDWITDDVAAAHREELYKELTEQYERYLQRVINCIGGIYLSELGDGGVGKAYEAVPRDLQKRAVSWVLRQLQESAWLDNPELVDKFGLGLPNSWRIRNSLINSYFGRMSYVTLSSHVADVPYTMDECMRDVYAGVWESALRGRPLNRVDKLIQRAWMTNTKREIVDIGGNRIGLTKDVVPEHILLSAGKSFELQQAVATDMIDERDVYFYKMLRECKSMLEKAVVSAPEDDRAHYRAMLLMATKMLKNK